VGQWLMNFGMNVLASVSFDFEHVIRACNYLSVVLDSSKFAEGLS
jgi:hypothetical protein